MFVCVVPWCSVVGVVVGVFVCLPVSACVVLLFLGPSCVSARVSFEPSLLMNVCVCVCVRLLEEK